MFILLIDGCDTIRTLIELSLNFSEPIVTLIQVKLNVGHQNDPHDQQFIWLPLINVPFRLNAAPIGLIH
jgi:hypothetical protein